MAISRDEIEREKKRLPRGSGRFGKLRVGGRDLRDRGDRRRGADLTRGPRGGRARSASTRRRHRRRLRRSPGGAQARAHAGRRHARRPPELPPVPAARLPGRDRRAVAGGDRPPAKRSFDLCDEPCGPGERRVVPRYAPRSGSTLSHQRIGLHRGGCLGVPIERSSVEPHKVPFGGVVRSIRQVRVERPAERSGSDADVRHFRRPPMLIVS